MDIEAPTFNSLNKPQKRALILRDQLRFLDPQHLDSFLEGVSDHEPPRYTRIDGAIKPELVFVTLKDEATYFDLGNVLFPEDKNAVHRVYLVIESGQIHLRLENPLPQDEDVLDSLPIHGFIAKGMVPLFKEKYQAILFRMNKINEARRAVYTMVCEASTSSHQGETLTKPNPAKTKKDHKVSPSKRLASPEPRQELKRHTFNKRKRTNLDTVSEDTKRGILDTISDSTKVSLFDSIINMAFPHFENAMTASRNVVSIYSASGSNFAALHCAIVDLKRVLQDFDESFGQQVDRETPRYRQDFVGSSRSDGGYHTENQSESTSSTNTSHQTARPCPSPKRQKRAVETENPAAPATQQEAKERGASDSGFDDIPHVDPRLSTSNTPQLLASSSSSSSSPPPSNKAAMPPLHTPSITALHQASVLRFQTNNAAPDTRRTDNTQATAQVGWDMGNSVLGARKKSSTMGVVAPIVDTLSSIRRKQAEKNAGRNGEEMETGKCI